MKCIWFLTFVFVPHAVLAFGADEAANRTFKCGSTKLEFNADGSSARVNGRLTPVEWGNNTSSNAGVIGDSDFISNRRGKFKLDDTQCVRE